MAELHDPNPHARNLNLISLGFILFWLLDVRTVGSALSIYPINVEVTSPQFLPWVVWGMLFWFIWRFWVTSTDSFWKEFDDANTAGRVTSALPEEKKLEIITNHYEQIKDFWIKELDRMKSSMPPIEELRVRKLYATFQSNRAWTVEIAIDGQVERLKQEVRLRNLKKELELEASLLRGFTIKRLCIFLATNGRASDFVPPYLLAGLAIVAGVLTLIGCHP